MSSLMYESHTPPDRASVDFGRMPARTRVLLVDKILDLTSRELITRAEGLTWLRQARLTADEQAFDNALQALTTRDGLLDARLDPFEVAGPAPSVGVERLREWAVGEQERDLAHAVDVLTRPAGA